MDVHAPLEPVHTWKDIGIHLAIVTVGLFIALMMEAGVEYWHHRHIVAQARENIRTELERNHRSAAEDVGYLGENLTRIRANIQTLHQIEKQSKLSGSLTNKMTFSTLDDAAWSTARTTGALAYMPYDEVQQYSDIYSAQQEVNQKARATADLEFLSMAPVLVMGDAKNIATGDVESMLHQSGATLIELCTLQQYVQELDGQYIDALKLEQPHPKVSDCESGK